MTLTEFRYRLSIFPERTLTLNIDQRDPTFVALPPEHPMAGSDKCGRLLRHMYGTQKAADGWQGEYEGTLIQLGFKQGVSCPCVFWHEARGLVCSVHGDDFTTAGPRTALNWFEAEMEKTYELLDGNIITSPWAASALLHVSASSH